MQVSVENSGGLERKVRVQVPEEKISAQVQSRLQSLSKTTKVEGFRPGKVPMKVIQGRYGAQVRQEIVGQIVQSSFQEAITQENLNPAGMPTIDPLEDKAGEGLNYTATFEVVPEFTLNPVSELTIEKPVCEISDEDITKMTETLQKQQIQFETADKAVEEGDAVIMDFVGKIDGEAFEGGSAEDFQLEIGSGRFIEGFEDGLKGSKTGDEKDLELTFPEDYPQEELAGKATVFSVKVKEVKTGQLPELNDEFFKQFGVEEGGLEAFQGKLRENMGREIEQRIKNLARDNVLDALFEANEITLPKVMVENEAQRLHEQMKQNLLSQGIPADALEKADASVYEEQAKKRVSLQLILADIIKKNDMKADPGKVRAIIESQAQGYEDPSAIINWYYGDQSRLAEVEAVALEEEIVNWTLDQAKITESKMAFDEIMNKGQTGGA